MTEGKILKYDSDDNIYQGYYIEPDSCQDEKGRWVPRASIYPTKGQPSKEIAPLVWQKVFDNKREADDFALQGAELYIDEEY